MTPQEFAYWLNGFFELSGDLPQGLSAEQVRTIRNHLALVFHHSIDPQYPGDPQELQDIHDGTPPHLKPQHHKPGDMIFRC